MLATLLCYQNEVRYVILLPNRLIEISCQFKRRIMDSLYPYTGPSFSPSPYRHIMYTEEIYMQAAQTLDWQRPGHT